MVASVPAAKATELLHNRKKVRCRPSEADVASFRIGSVSPGESATNRSFTSRPRSPTFVRQVTDVKRPYDAPTVEWPLLVDAVAHATGANDSDQPEADIPAVIALGLADLAEGF